MLQPPPLVWDALVDTPSIPPAILVFKIVLVPALLAALPTLLSVSLVLEDSTSLHPTHVCPAPIADVLTALLTLPLVLPVSQGSTSSTESARAVPATAKAALQPLPAQPSTTITDKLFKLSMETLFSQFAIKAVPPVLHLTLKSASNALVVTTS